MTKIDNIHPGEILRKEFLITCGISKFKLSKETGLLQTTVDAIVSGRRRVTPVIAKKLSAYFGNHTSYWVQLQNDFDLKDAASEPL